MDYTLTHDKRIEAQTTRVLGILTMAVLKKGYVTIEDIQKHIKISTPDLIEIRDALLANGTIEDYVP